MSRDRHVTPRAVLDSGMDYAQCLGDAGATNLCKHGKRQLYCTACHKLICAQWGTIISHCTESANHIEALVQKEKAAGAGGTQAAVTDAYAALTAVQLEQAAVALAAAHGLPVRPLFEALRADDALLHNILRQLRCVRSHPSINGSLCDVAQLVEDAVGAEAAAASSVALAHDGADFCGGRDKAVAVVANMNGRTRLAKVVFVRDKAKREATAAALAAASAPAAGGAAAAAPTAPTASDEDRLSELSEEESEELLEEGGGGGGGGGEHGCGGGGDAVVRLDGEYVDRLLTEWMDKYGVAWPRIVSMTQDGASNAMRAARLFLAPDPGPAVRFPPELPVVMYCLAHLVNLTEEALCGALPLLDEVLVALGGVIIGVSRRPPPVTRIAALGVRTGV